MFDYVFTETAEADIDGILEYIARELQNPDAASAFADELEKKIDEICKSPKSGRPVDNKYLIRTDVRRFLEKNYTAYYIIDEDSQMIVILRVVYTKRNLDRVLRNL